MYLVFAVATTLILPLISAAIDIWLHPGEPWMLLVGRWFIFWGVGVRIFAAGVKQTLQPEFTATQIFKMKGTEALPIIRELGISNTACGLVGLASIFAPSFLLPIAIFAAIFYGGAGIGHFKQPSRSSNENIALWTDLLMAVVLVAFVVWSLGQ